MAELARARGNGFTDRQNAFIREYPVDCTVEKAAIRAGYSPRSARAAGNYLMRNPRIVAAIRDAMDKQSEKVQITKQWLLSETAALYKAAKQDKAHAAAARCIELAAKLTGNLIEKREIRQITSVADLTEEELRALAAEPHPGTAGADRTKH